MIPPEWFSVHRHSGGFVKIIYKSFGFVIGFIISWSATIVGCILSYTLFKYLFSKKIDKYLSRKNLIKISKISNSIKNVSFPNLVLIIALPFSPAFLINIVCGLTNVKFKKFFFHWKYKSLYNSCKRSYVL